MLTIDLASSDSLEEQIAAGLRRALAEGSLGPGHDLPSVRQLAGDLGVHWNTVARAYRRLADDGLIVLRRGRSTVARAARKRTRRTAPPELAQRFRDLIAEAILRGVPRAQIFATFQESLASFGDGD